MAVSTLPATASHARAWPVWSIMPALVVVGTLVPALLMASSGRTPSLHFWATAFFFAVNALIAFFELALFRHADAIRDEYEAARNDVRGRELGHILAFFNRRLTTAEVFTTRPWAGVWASYSVMDPAYADKRSFGFTIDIGNGFSTLAPSLLLPLAIVFEWPSARIVGIAMVVFSWQMFYGTVLYFTSYVLNRRYVGHRLADLLVFVGLSNLIWTTFPIWTGALGVWMVLSNDYAMFTG